MGYDVKLVDTGDKVMWVVSRVNGRVKTMLGAYRDGNSLINACLRLADRKRVELDFEKDRYEREGIHVPILV